MTDDRDGALWPPGAATGVGSMPGTDPAEALRVVLGELPDLPHLPELPARGPGADLIGRGAGFLVDLPVDLQPSGWRLVDRPGRDARRIRDLLARDLDVLVELAGDYAGPFKVQVCGVWTLAASLELHHGDKALSDPGAVRDLAASLADGVAAHLADVRRRLPSATVLVQLDEPSLPAVLAGAVPTASGFGTLPRPEPSTVESTLAAVVAAPRAADAPVVVHCCAAEVPYPLLHRAGAAAVSVDLARLDVADTAAVDALGERLDDGLGLVAGVVPSLDPAVDSGRSDPAASVSGVRRLWHRLGLPPERLRSQVAVSPSCGLAGASPRHARAALATSREAGRRLADDPESSDG